MLQGRLEEATARNAEFAVPAPAPQGAPQAAGPVGRQRGRRLRG
jgi:hypothetical protein